MKKRLISLLLTLSMVFSMVPMLGIGVEAAVPLADYPYPSLLKYSELDKTFESEAKNLIMSKYRDYVLNAIKYHIESSTSNYRVAKNLLQKFNSNQDGNVVFFFDGCSTNLEGTTPIFSGYLKDEKRYNTSAVCIVVRANSKGMPYIAYATNNASTMADNVRNIELNYAWISSNKTLEYSTISITKDGMYNIIAVNHNSDYAALQIKTTTGSAVRCTKPFYGIPSTPNPPVRNGITYTKQSVSVSGISNLNSQGSGINIHSRGYTGHNAALSNTTRSSTGCFNIGREPGDAEYNEFIEVVTGLSDAYIDKNNKKKFSSTATSLGFTNGSIVGITIIDRSNYISQLKTIYGNDAPKNANGQSISGGYTAKQIVDAITAQSNEWHDAILERVEEEDIKVSKITVSSDGTSSSVSIWDSMIVNGYYYGTGTKTIKKDSNATVKWTKNADKYDVWATVIEGDPDPGNDVSVARLDGGTGWLNTTSNSITLPSSVMKNYGGKWAKVAISAKENDGTVSRMSCFYFLISSVGSTHIRGDANGDGVKNTSDFTYALIHIVTKGLVNKNVAESLDYNGDGQVTTSDATYLLIHIVTKGVVNKNLH